MLPVLFLSCNTNTGSNNNSSGKISETRSAVNPNAVKVYTETVKSFETTDEFKVALFETKETYNYLIKINYKNGKICLNIYLIIKKNNLFVNKQFYITSLITLHIL